jgi:hypothetical protein
MNGRGANTLNSARHQMQVVEEAAMLSAEIDARRSGVAGGSRRGLFRAPGLPHKAVEAARLFNLFRERIVPIAAATCFVLGLNLLQLYAVTNKIAPPSPLGPGWDCFKSACIKIPAPPAPPDISKGDEILAPRDWWFPGR